MSYISQQFVRRWSQEYDDRNKDKPDGIIEREIKDWLDALPEPKYLDKEHFVKLAKWKSPRPRKHYEANDDTVIRDVTTKAYLKNDAMDKLVALDSLKGVGTKVAATILHFLFPDRFPIFDYHVCNALIEAGKWKRDKRAASHEAWAEYVGVMQTLARELGVTLRELDKALITYDQNKRPDKRR